MSQPTITEDEVKALNSAILARYGLDFSGYEPKSYIRRLHRVMRMNQLDNTMALWGKVLHQSGFIQEFINQLSVGLTSLFRDPIMWAGLQAHLRAVQPHSRPLRIWHAGCSTGEEVWSMAILLREIGWRQPVEVLATDMSEAVLTTAAKGSYPSQVWPDYRANYQKFNPKGNLSAYLTSQPDGSAQFTPNLLPPIRWVQHNLVTDPYPGDFDIVFCRNVMIYFDGPTKQRLVPDFLKALKPGGLFIIGFFDALVPLLSAHHLTALDSNTKIFIKQPAD